MPERTALRIVAIVCRVLAIALAVLVVMLSVATTGGRAWLVMVSNVADSIVPLPLLGTAVMETPFGGAFRGDFAIISVVLFIVDWACSKAAAHIRRPERGGQDEHDGHEGV